jgi:hypothetical protein
MGWAYGQLVFKREAFNRTACRRSVRVHRDLVGTSHLFIVRNWMLNSHEFGLMMFYCVRRLYAVSMSANGG